MKSPAHKAALPKTLQPNLNQQPATLLNSNSLNHPFLNIPYSVPCLFTLLCSVPAPHISISAFFSVHNPNIQWRKYISIALDDGTVDVLDHGGGIVRMMKVGEEGIWALCAWGEKYFCCWRRGGVLGVWDLETL
jgi:hypothetical protein